MFKKISPQLLLNVATILIVAVIVFVGQATASGERIFPAGDKRPAPAGAVPAASTIPGTMAYQGVLTTAGGEPINGTRTLAFRIYDAPSAGNMLWQESQTLTLVNGDFNVRLGSVVPFTNEIWHQDNLYLAIQVGTDAEMTPRQLIGAVPQSLGVPPNSVTETELALGAATSMRMAPDWFEAWTPAWVETQKQDPQWENVGTTITFSCETDCTALILHRGLIMASAANTRINVQIRVDGVVAFRELAIFEANFVPVSGYGLENLSAGTHTVSIQFTCSQYTPAATCRYYGDSSGLWERLTVMLFAQAE